MLYIHLIIVSEKSSNRAREMHGVARELNVVIFALKKLGNIFPIAGMYIILQQVVPHCLLIHRLFRYRTTCYDARARAL
jgi:hypothetical protein